MRDFLVFTTNKGKVYVMIIHYIYVAHGPFAVTTQYALGPYCTNMHVMKCYKVKSVGFTLLRLVTPYKTQEALSFVEYI